MKQTNNPAYTIERLHYKGYSMWKWNGSACKPMLILRKPKHLSDDEYESFVKSLYISIKL